ncbi:nucleotidyltransferase family protein [Pseudogracilibacillus auburnensis]|uniref:Nucleotidyltransferase-like protein n=2 Tax=Pseudogracilibacillus auburnensis TaxID=1494959 RepID=A0A2V3VZJ7_9BACI|nr:nucleotidyltransferase domain-containing protein [Pseudogracilibacillus auburnensis]PXW87493.1 nucleotidyltransferase-like protein [Pseudogracilibacillus auburnensis]
MRGMEIGMGSLQAGYGLDGDGYIMSDVALDKIDNVYFTCIRESVEELVRLFPHQLHSVYVYGSVARGEAVAVKSDLDLLAMFNDTLGEKELVELKAVTKVLSRKYHTLVRDVGIAVANYDYVVDPANYYEQAFLKELCVCVHGEDLREQFGLYKLTSEIAISFNGDIHEVLARTMIRLEAATIDEFKILVQNFARKMIRTYYSMVMVRSQIWSTRLHEQSDVFIHYFPHKEPIIHTLQKWIEEPPINRELVLDLFQNEGKWVTTNFEREAHITS